MLNEVAPGWRDGMQSEAALRAYNEIIAALLVSRDFGL